MTARMIATSILIPFDFADLQRAFALLVICTLFALLLYAIVATTKPEPKDPE